MKTRTALASALFLASLTASPVLASGDCVYSGYNQGSPDVFKFVKWEFGKRDGRWLKVNLTLHNKLKQTVKWFELTMLADGHSISLNTTQTLPAESDALITAKYEMSNESAAEFQKLTPLICVRSTEDEKGDKQKYD
ncbi:MAG: hypothetical protein BGN91_06690 [Nitrobacter sp. 62-13]|jgi:hypothetical protein|uniref:hypothetical protein n=1 Tax=Nitrobacter sp. 62-13 TaxID=1895797 RepID=UPI0009609181|nr:hypothetical protein [Nitrobacter sp. 62-13]OJU30245.1 MAG: hypothetical protein BGN91_06690 [Nitrobacter sp. 62-13]